MGCQQSKRAFKTKTGDEMGANASKIDEYPNLPVPVKAKVQEENSSKTPPPEEVTDGGILKVFEPGWEPSWGSSMASTEVVALVPSNVPLATKAKRLPLETVIDVSETLGRDSGYDIVAMNMDDFIRCRGCMMVGLQGEKMPALVHKQPFGEMLNTKLSGVQKVQLPKLTVMRSLEFPGLSTSLTIQHCNVSAHLREKMFRLWPTLVREALIPIGPPSEKAVRALAWRPNAFKEFHACHFAKQELDMDADSTFMKCVAACRGVYTQDPVLRVKRISRGGIFSRVSSGTRLVERLLLVVAACASTVDLWFAGFKDGKPLPRNSSKANENLMALFVTPLSETLRMPHEDVIAIWQRQVREMKTGKLIIAAACIASLLDAKGAQLRNVRDLMTAIAGFPTPQDEAVRLDALVSSELKQSAVDFARSDFSITMDHGRIRSRHDEVLRSYLVKSFKGPPAGGIALKTVIDDKEWKQATPDHYYVVRMQQSDAKAKGAMALSYRWKHVIGPLTNVNIRLPRVRPFKSGGFFPVELDQLQMDVDRMYWMDFLNHLNNPILRKVSMQTMGTAYIAHDVEPAHLFQGEGDAGLERLWIFQEIAFGKLNRSALDSSNNKDASLRIGNLNDASLEVSPNMARESIKALVACDATRESDRYHATLHSVAVRLGMTLLPVGVPPISEDRVNELCDEDPGRYVRCMRVLRRLLEIGGPQRYFSSHKLPRGLKTLGLGFVENGEWYELGKYHKVRACSNSRTLAIEVETCKGEILRKLNAFDRDGSVGGILVEKGPFA